MTYVFLCYGLSFFGLGVIAVVYPRTYTSLRLGRHLWLLGVFGILHGLNEFSDMLVWLETGDRRLLEDGGLVLLSASFFFLLQYGVSVGLRRRLARALPASLLVVWLGLSAVFDGQRENADALARYVLGLPGALAAALAFGLEARRLAALKLPARFHSLWFLSGAFALYALFAGAIVGPAAFFPASVLNSAVFLEHVGVPVQVFRMACAALAAYALIRMLRLFQWDQRRVLAEAEERYGVLIDEAPDAIVVLRQGRIDALNEAAVALLAARSPSQVAGKPFTWFAHEDSRGTLADALEEEQAFRGIRRIEATLERLDGTLLDADLVVSGLLFARGPVVEVVFRDSKAVPDLEGGRVAEPGSGSPPGSQVMPICAWCKGVQEEHGDWTTIEAYLSRRSGLFLTHGICPTCYEKYWAYEV